MQLSKVKLHFTNVILAFVYMIKRQNQNPTASFLHSWLHHVKHQVTNDFHQIDDNKGERKLQKLNCILILETTPNGAPIIPTTDALIPYPTTTIIVVLLFIRIIFGYIFEYNSCKNMRFFENKNMKCEFNFWGNGYDCGDLFSIFNYGVLLLVAAPSPTLFDFNVLRIGLRDKLDLKYLFGVNDNGNDFGHDENKNVEIVKCEVDFGDLFYGYYYPLTTFPTPAHLCSTSVFDGIDNGLSEINIAESVFGVIHKYGVKYDMDSETLYGMF